MREVYVAGIGMTGFGENWERSLRQLMTEAGLSAVADAGVSGPDIDAMYVASTSAGRLLGQQQLGVLALDEAGLASSHIPATRIEAGDASGAAAFRSAYLAVASGAHDVVLAGGAEKMTDVLENDVIEAQVSSADMEWEGFFGATLPGLYAMMTRAYMAEHGTTPEQLANVAVKNHEHGAKNPKAAYPFTIDTDKVLGSPVLADPIRMLDSAAAIDGAAAIVLVSGEVLDRLEGTQGVRVLASAQASDTLALHRRDSITTIESTRVAARDAFEIAELSPADVDVAEVHDVYTVAELMALEALGVYEPGQAAGATEKGRTTFGGDLVVNPSGGLKARGHAMGATGVAQVCEITAQLRAQADDRQVEGARVGLTHAVAGTGGTSLVHLFEAPDGGDA